MSIIEVSGLSKAYGPKRAVQDVSFEVREGEIFGVLGPNGAGKTTTVECVIGLRTPDTGRIRVAGFDPVTQRPALTRVLGAQLQEGELPPKITVREVLELYTAFYPGPAPWRPLAERLGLDKKLDGRFQKLSGGQKQRLLIALALIGNPRVVVLDELTTGLDPRARRETWQLIEELRDAGVTVLLVTHFMAEAQRLCDRLAVIDAGRVVALDTPEGLVGRASATAEISFLPSAPLEVAELEALPEVASVQRKSNGRLIVGGTDETVNAVIGLLVGRGLRAHQLRVTEATLDDAYLDLTGGTAEFGPHAGETTGAQQTGRDALAPRPAVAGTHEKRS
ncbi:ABC transporter ATP-binding protein [Streptomyces sp. XM4193]|uniref:ABC transporter ATP-binding protein n=1 Tax=Streptomyces sp. XM4193 TaxID=2929782 RepID=UPI001FF7163F|nr:ABC transporter ATP-binding protein [Streptomyces sp. XM4193]MCK1798420.1 ABC transporter ATP-binding protein [Streptomyces sp. XM4193]